ncbi:jg398 [Pararge aegeria aegeria]|uniref:Jg398 protein n=1 Tax=Pararge aegeria aegeria TaxID=348720 RepID=A0A8S4QX25_9NEOP|nr:jg398 [Pararge aegeria aegeria]
MWLNVVEANAISFGWADEVVKYQALQKLRNTAKTWYDSLQKNETRWTSWKWKDWRNTLSDTFQIKRNTFLLLKQLLDTKPNDGQSLYEFYFQQKSKIDRLRLGFRENDIISIIVGTIGDTQLCNAAEAGSFKYCDDLASFLHSKVQQDLNNSNQQVINKKFASFSKSRFDTKPEVGSFQFPSTGSQLSNTNSRGQPTCFRCGEIGHKRNFCSVKDSVKCTFCLKSGHLELACKGKLKGKTEKDVEVKSVSSEKQKFFKNIFLNDKPCIAFIDMGSDCSLIVPSLVNKLGLLTRELEKPVKLTGFTNSITIEVNKAIESTLKIDKVELMVTMYVIDSLSDCEILIGRNFTEHRNIMYSRIGDSLLFDNVAIQVSMINVPNLNISCSDKEPILKNLLNKYPKCISNDLSTLGKTSSVELQIDLTTSKPVYQRPYRMSEQEKVITREIVDDLLHNGIIRHSNSSYASPALLVDKSSGEKRLCIDYRQLNKITVKEKYPMPMIEDLIDRLRGCTYFTSLDLKSGYYHIPIKEQDVHKTAFITSDGHYEFTRMPFGLSNGPAIFQRLMNTVLGNLRFGNIICYMDDLLIATNSLDENISSLEDVLNILSEHGFTLNITKCSFFQKKIGFLGYEISKEGIRPSPKKTECSPKLSNTN